MKGNERESQCIEYQMSKFYTFTLKINLIFFPIQRMKD